jgi:hypothetical protein
MKPSLLSLHPHGQQARAAKRWGTDPSNARDNNKDAYFEAPACTFSFDIRGFRRSWNSFPQVHLAIRLTKG